MGVQNAYIDDEFFGSGFSDQGSIDLCRGLDFYYGLEAASGTREDVGPNSLNLSETGTVGQVPGIISNAASFPGVGGNKLSHVFDSVYDYSAKDFTITGWVKLDTKITDQELLYIGTGGGASVDLHLDLRYITGTDSIQARISDGTTTNMLADDLGGGGIPTGEFIFLACTWNNVTKDLRLRLNGQASVLSNLPAFNIQNVGTQSFILGGKVNNSDPLDGPLDEISGYNRVLNNAELNFFYNNGNGNRPIFIVTHLGEPVTYLGEQVVHNP